MQITDVKATLHRIPIEAPLLKEKIWTPIVFVTVETDQGIKGYGLTRAAQRFGAREFIDREAAPFLRGKNPVETERIWQQLYKAFNPRAQTGMWSSAVSAIDIALWDIKGKYYKEPVWRLLGGAQNPVPAYVTFGLRDYTKEQLVEVAKSFVAQGGTPAQDGSSRRCGEPERGCGARACGAGSGRGEGVNDDRCQLMF